MFNHFTFAVNGLKPNFKTFNVASFGFDFDVEITVQPVDGGGRGFGIPDYNEYIVTVKVRYKDKTWVTQRVVNNLGLAALEKVVAAFRGTVKVMDKIYVGAHYTMQRISTMININTRYKSKSSKD